MILSLGALYDSEGNLRQWWTNETMDLFTNRTRCVQNYYDSLFVDGIQVNCTGCGALRLPLFISFSEERRWEELFLSTEASDVTDSVSHLCSSAAGKWRNDAKRKSR